MDFKKVFELMEKYTVEEFQQDFDNLISMVENDKKSFLLSCWRYMLEDFVKNRKNLEKKSIKLSKLKENKYVRYRWKNSRDIRS